MGEINDLARDVYRDQLAPGSALPNDPEKARIRNLWDRTDQKLEAAAAIGVEVEGLGQSVEALAGGASFGGAVSKATKALLDADLAYPADRLAVVWNDPDLTKRGVYAKVGASGTGSWSLTSLAPDSSLRPDLNTEIAFRAARLVADMPAQQRAALIDGDGLAGWSMGDDGVMRMHGLRANLINGRDHRSSGRFDAQINGVSAYGQSWEVGETLAADGAAISTTQRYANLMFNGGVRPRDLGGTVEAQHNAFAPLVESTLGNKGESPMAGWTDFATQLIADEDGLMWDRSGYQFLATSAAKSNTTLAQLADGTQPFTDLKADIEFGFKVANLIQFKSYVFRAFSWMQSVADYSAATSPATWKAGLITLRNDVDAYAKSMTGQADDVLCIMAQPGWAGAYEAADYPWADLAMLDLAETEDHFVLACPSYFLPMSSDAPHFTARGNRIRGAYYGLAYKRSLVDGEAFKPLRPVEIRRQGKIMTVRFNPVGALKNDTTILGAIDDMGFSLVTSAGVAIAIDSARITSRDTVTLLCATAPAAGAKLRYGFSTTGMGGGNLRDSQGDTMVFDPAGTNHPMHNWCVIFEKVLA